MQEKFDEAWQENKVARMEQAKQEKEQRAQQAKWEAEKKRLQDEADEKFRKQQRDWELKLVSMGNNYSTGYHVGLDENNGWTCHLNTPENNKLFGEWCKQWGSSCLVALPQDSGGMWFCPTDGTPGSRGTLPPNFVKKLADTDTNANKVKYATFGPNGKYF